MDVVSNNYMPGDPRLIDEIVNELKSQGIFDNFRKECIADVDTKPAYQNLRQRVEGTVLGFLKTQKWKPDLNKNHVRELLRKNIYESGFLEIGVERIVDQVVNPKVNTVFLSKVEEVVYKYLGIQKPNRNETSITRNGSFIYNDNLLPNDLEAISPDSEVLDKCLNYKLDISIDSDKLDDSKIDEDESPPFEPIEEQSTYMPQDESSMDSHLSGISGLISHDSNSNNNETQMSKISSESRLSIVTSPENDVKMDISEDSTTQMSKSSKNGEIIETKTFNFDFPSFETDKNFVSNNVKIEKDIEGKNDEKKESIKEKKEHRRDSERTRHKHSDSKERRDESKDQKDESKERKDEFEEKPEHSKDKKTERKDEAKIKKDEIKDKKEEIKDNKKDDRKDYSKDKKDEKRSDKDKKHVSSSSKDKSSSRDRNKDNKTKETNSSSNNKTEKDKDSKSKSSSSSKHKSSNSSSSSRKDSSHITDKSKSSSKSKDSKVKSSSETPKLKELTKSSSKSSSDSKTKTSSKDDKYRSKTDRHDKKSDKKKENGKREIKDDHYSWKSKKTSRRSTDRDSNDGHSNIGTNSTSSFLTESSGSLQTNNVDSSSNSAASGGNSDEVVHTKNCITDITTVVTDTTEVLIAPEVTVLEPIKLIKPRFASNIFEARRLMKIRKKMEKIQKKMQQQYVQNIAAVVSKNSESSEHSDKTVIPIDASANEIEKEELVNNAVISKESWDAIEAKLSSIVDYNSYKESSSLNKEFNIDDSSVSNESPFQTEDETMKDTDSMPSKDSPSAKDDVSTDTNEDLSRKGVVSSMSSDDGEDLKYLSPSTSPKTERFLEHVASMQEQSLNVTKSRRTRKPNMKYCSSDFDSEVTFSTEAIPDYDSSTSNYDNFEVKTEKKKGIRKPLKRKADKETECISDNNNKKISNHLDVPEFSAAVPAAVGDKSIKRKTETETEQNPSAASSEMKSGSAKSKIRPISRGRKPKRLDTPPVHIDSFPMPLSPAESDVSASSLDMKRVSEEPDIAPPKVAKPSARGQRYSSDDLYKPRPAFLGSRRRNARNKDALNDGTL